MQTRDGKRFSNLALVCEVGKKVRFFVIVLGPNRVEKILKEIKKKYTCLMSSPSTRPAPFLVAMEGQS